MTLCVCGGIIEGAILFLGSFILTRKALDFVEKLFRRRKCEKKEK